MRTNLVRRTLAALGLTIAVVGTASAEAPRLADLAGTWQMRGYGKVLDISAQRLVIYDITDVSCAREKELPVGDATAEYDRIALTPTGFSAFAPGGITRYAFERLKALPDRCRGGDEQPLRDPELNFSVLWHAFRENYAFFDLRDVRWDDIYARFRPKVLTASTEEQLFDVLSQVLAALNDGHVGLRSDKREFSSGGHGEIFDLWSSANPIKSLEEAEGPYHSAIDSFVVDGVLKGNAKHGANGILTWGWAAPRVGYINVARMYMEPIENGIELPEQIELVDQAMQRALQDLAKARALIIDARFNPGGHDAIALSIVGHLTTEKRLAFTKKAVTSDGYTDTQEVHISPRGKRQYTGPVYYLQSGNTVSAAEIFSLAMMSLPNVTRVGTPTYGVLSDVLVKKLPNGWSLGLSNELYVARDGNLYEGKGIPPHVAVPAKTARNFRERVQLDIDTALALIRKADSAPR